eukprot:gene34289-42285_t
MSFLNDASKSTILITGGASGLGLAFAKRLVNLGHTVIAVGRRQLQLDLAKEQVPGLNVIKADVSTDANRVALFERVIKDFPEVNVLINNAGVFHFGPPVASTSAEDWQKHKEVNEINYLGPVHLTTLFLPSFVAKPNALIANVTGMLIFHPLAAAAITVAGKEALHSFTISLRHQLKDASVKVIEIIPPAVDTGINGMHFGMDLDMYADDTIAQILEGKNKEIGYQSDKVIRGTRDELEAIFEQLNSPDFQFA